MIRPWHQDILLTRQGFDSVGGSKYRVMHQKCLRYAILAPESNCSSAHSNYDVMGTSRPVLLNTLPLIPRRPLRQVARHRYYLDYCLLVALFLSINRRLESLSLTLWPAQLRGRRDHFEPVRTP
jgi:hypothetical protein